MIKQGTQALLSFIGTGRLASTGVETDKDGNRRGNAASKAEIQKMTSFVGAINPKTGKFENIINPSSYINSSKPFPKKYYWSKHQYIEPTYHDVVRRTKWTWDQIQAMLDTPLNMSEKQWSKLPDEEKIKLHAKACCLEGETQVTVVYVE